MNYGGFVRAYGGFTFNMWIAAISAVVCFEPQVSAATLTWNSNTTGSPVDGSGTWGANSNWWNGAADTVWSNSAANTAQFGAAAGSTAYTVTLSGPQTVGSLTFQSDAYTLLGATLNLAGSAPVVMVNASGGTIGSIITGTGGLTQMGTGLLSLTASNAYSGGTTISQGTLIATTSGALGSGSITLNNGNTGSSNTALIVSAGNNLSNSVTVANQGTGLATVTFAVSAPVGGINTPLGSMTLNNATDLNFPYSGGSLYQFSTPVSGTGPVIITSGSNYLLAHASWSSYTGPITIAAGSDFDFRGFLGTSATNAVTVNGTMWDVSSDTLGALSGSGTVSTISGFGGGTESITVGNGGIASMFSGVLGQQSGQILSLLKTGGGVLTLTGSSSYTGKTTISQGTLQLGNSSNVPLGVTSGYSIAAGSNLYLNFGSAVTTGAWSQSVSGAGTLELNSAQPVNGTAQWGQNNSTATNFGPAFTGTLKLDNGRIDSSPAGLGGISNIAIGSGATFLAWPGTYNMPISIAGYGWGETGFAAALRSSPAGQTNWTGPVTLTGNAGISAQAGGGLMLAGPLTGNFTADFEATVFGSGAIVLAPSGTVQNSYGTTQLEPGTIVFAGNQYAFSTGPLVMNGGTLSLNGYNATFANLSGANGVIESGSGTAATITVGTDNTSTVYSGIITNGGTSSLTLSKTGTGMLTLNGASSTIFQTVVDGGTLRLSAGQLVSTNLAAGYSSTGSFSQTGGTNQATLNFVLGYNSGASGSYNLSGGSLTIAPAAVEAVGVLGSGSFTQTGGTNNVPTYLLVGAGGPSGTYNLSGNGLLNVVTAEIGVSGPGSFIQSGGTNTVQGLLSRLR